MKRILSFLFGWLVTSSVAVTLLAQSPVTVVTYEQSTVNVTPVDKKGKTVSTDGPLTWAISGAAGIAQLRPSTGTTICDRKCDVVGLSPGQVNVVVTGDSKIGPGVNTITLTLPVTITPAEAVGFTYTVDPPVPDPLAGIPVTGAVTLSAALSDDTGLSVFTYLIDDLPWVSVPVSGETATVEQVWNSDAVPVGRHVIRGEAVDANGNVGAQDVLVRVVRP